MERLGLVEPGDPNRLAGVGRPGHARVGERAAGLPAIRCVTCSLGTSSARGWWPGSRARGWAAAISIASAATRLARSTIGCAGIRRRLIRYDRGCGLSERAGVVRGQAGAAGRICRSAAVHDPGFGRGLRNYTGVGAAAEVPAPFGTLRRGRVGVRLSRRERKRYTRHTSRSGSAPSRCFESNETPHLLVLSLSDRRDGGRRRAQQTFRPRSISSTSRWSSPTSRGARSPA